MFQKLILALSLMLLLLAQRQALPAKEYSAERFDVAIAVQEGGSLIITEAVTFKFVGGPFTFVFRDIPTDKTDGISISSASMDGQTMQQGTEAGQVEIAYGNPVKVTWHFTPVSDQTHTFVLTYKVLGVFQQESDADVLHWETVPTHYDYAIRSSTISVSYPDWAILLGTPEVVRGSAQVTTSTGKVVFLAHDSKPNSPLEIGLKFRAGSVITTAPHWQQRQAQAIALILPYLIGGLAIFLIGSLGLIWYYRRYRRWPSFTELDTAPLTAPPADLPPAIAGALLSRTPTWNNALAALFDLAGRGVLLISQSMEPRKWYQAHAEFLIEMQTQPAHLRPHELGLLALLFQTKKGMQTSTSVSNISRSYSGRSQRFIKPLQQEMTALGLYDMQRQHMRRQFGMISILLLIISCIGVILGLLFGIPGTWPIVFLPLGVMALSATAAVLWSMFSMLSDEGLQASVRWKAFSRYLRDITQSKEPDIPAETFERYLSYAASFGLAEHWVKYFQKQGMAVVPPWFQSLATADADALSYFVTMIIVTHAVVGSSHGATGGGGAAGGGSSGAG